MKLFYDKYDLPNAEKLKDDRFKWLRELGATELGESHPEDTGFLFSYEHGEAHLTKQVGDRLGIHDRPVERRELINLDDVLHKLHEAGVSVPMPKTWVIGIDDEMPHDLTFPLFVRTRKSSWKRGGGQAKVRNLKELNDEAGLLRRAFGWDTPIIAREWLTIAPAGKWMFGDAPQEVRAWVVDGTPVAWSFHYLHAVQSLLGFPPSTEDLMHVRMVGAGRRSSRVGKPAVEFELKDASGAIHRLQDYTERHVVVASRLCRPFRADDAVVYEPRAALRGYRRCALPWAGMCWPFRPEGTDRILTMIGELSQ